MTDILDRMYRLWKKGKPKKEYPQINELGMLDAHASLDTSGAADVKA